MGSTTREVFHSGDPSASEASRRPSGTSLSTTSAVRVTVGSISTARDRAAEKPENPVFATSVVQEQAGHDRRRAAHGVDEIRTGAGGALHLVQVDGGEVPQGHPDQRGDPDLLEVPTMAWRPSNT